MAPHGGKLGGALGVPVLLGPAWESAWRRMAASLAVHWGRRMAASLAVHWESAWRRMAASLAVH